MGVIGMGRSGWELHVAPLQKFPDYRPVAVRDQGQARLNQAAQAFRLPQSL